VHPSCRVPTGSPPRYRPAPGSKAIGSAAYPSACLLPIACCLLPIACCLLPAAYCLLPVAYCLSVVAGCLTLAVVDARFRSTRRSALAGLRRGSAAATSRAGCACPAPPELEEPELLLLPVDPAARGLSWRRAAARKPPWHARSIWSCSSSAWLPRRLLVRWAHYVTSSCPDAPPPPPPCRVPTSSPPAPGSKDIGSAAYCRSLAQMSSLRHQQLLATWEFGKPQSHLGKKAHTRWPLEGGHWFAPARFQNLTPLAKFSLAVLGEGRGVKGG
jgi:hypothetical protein